MMSIIFFAFVLGCRTIGLPSISDMYHINTLVYAETTEKILHITPQRDGTVEVMTRVQRGPLDGRGQVFVLRRTAEGWKIIKRGSWVS